MLPSSLSLPLLAGVAVWPAAAACRKLQTFLLMMKGGGLTSPAAVCGDREDLPLYGILIPSPSCTEELLGRSGAGVPESEESWRDTGAGAESYQELNLILVAFL